MLDKLDAVDAMFGLLTVAVVLAVVLAELEIGVSVLALARVLARVLVLVDDSVPGAVKLAAAALLLVAAQCALQK